MNTARLALVMLVVIAALLTGCPGNKPAENPADGPGGAIQTPPETTTPADSGTTTTGGDQLMQAQQLISTGDFQGAIMLLEPMHASQPVTPEMTAALVEAHLGYAHQVGASPIEDVQLLNTVLYTHCMRITELDPTNAEAAEGVAQTKAWFEQNGMPVPDTIDPMLFLPPPADETATGAAGGEKPPKGERETDTE